MSTKYEQTIIVCKTQLVELAIQVCEFVLPKNKSQTWLFALRTEISSYLHDNVRTVLTDKANPYLQKNPLGFVVCCEDFTHHPDSANKEAKQRICIGRIISLSVYSLVIWTGWWLPGLYGDRLSWICLAGQRANWGCAHSLCSTWGLLFGLNIAQRVLPMLYLKSPFGLFVWIL